MDFYSATTIASKTSKGIACTLMDRWDLAPQIFKALQAATPTKTMEPAIIKDCLDLDLSIGFPKV